MVPLLMLWLPILLSAVLVFIASSIIHMVLSYHRSDMAQVPNEDKVMDALRPFAIPPNDYALPCAKSPKDSGSPEFLEKMNKGPVIVMTVMKTGIPSMATSLLLWFFYSVVVSIFAGYIAGRALTPGAPYLSVFRFVGCTAFIGYSLALWQGVIWWKRSCTATLKSTIDGLIYGLLTAGVFGWLWPS